MKQHILPRIKAFPSICSASETDFEFSDWEAILFKHDQIYRHKIMRINFTGYNVCRDEDVIHTGTQHSNIMVLTSDSVHPFSYAKVLGIFHTNITYIGEGNHNYRSCHLEFLWVRWYELQSSGSWAMQHLDEIRFPAMENDHSFGFLDPNDILRACYIIPCMKKGKTHSSNTSGISHLSQDIHDWQSYVVNWYLLALSLTLAFV